MRNLLQHSFCGLLLTLALSSAPARADFFIYYAQAGDTLWDLCLTYTNKRGCWIELGRLNKIANGRRIPVGHKILIPRSWLIEAPEVGTIVSVSGDSRLLRPGDVEVALKAGDSLRLGDSVVSGSGTVRLELGSRGQLMLRPGTELELENLSVADPDREEADLMLRQGELELDVQPHDRSRFEIRTPSAIAAVRGTQYRLAVLGVEDATRVEVLGGAVDFGSAGSTLVTEGFGAVAQKGEAPTPPRALLQAPVVPQLGSSMITPLALQWQAQAGAVAWRLDLYATTPGAELVESLSLEQPVALVSQPPGCYDLALWAVDDRGFNGMKLTQKLCLEVPPPPPPVEPEPPQKSRWPALLVLGVLALLWL